MAKIFSQRTLGKFEDASASIPLRQMDRAFDAVGIRMGEDPGGPAGARRTQFRRYIASVDQHDPQQLDRLGDALGALIEEVATSKQSFLVKAAENDGFFFADGVFRPAGTAPSSFAVTSVEDLKLLGDRASRLHVLADDNPKDAIAGAKELVVSVCRKTADLDDVTKSTLKTLELLPQGRDDAKKAAALIRRCLEQLADVVAGLDELRNVSPHHARLAIDAAVTLCAFVAETYLDPRGGHATRAGRPARGGS